MTPHSLSDRSPIRNARETDARLQAFTILQRLESGRITLDDLLSRSTEDFSAMSEPDRSLAYALIYGVLRWRERLDWMIGRFSNRAFRRIDPLALHALRMGLFQIVFLDRIPPSAAVNTSVSLVKSSQKPWLSGFVNALLRRAAREAGKLALPDPAKDPVEAISVAGSCPRWLVRRWIDRFGEEETGRLCEAINTVPPLTVRVNTLKTDRDRLLEAMIADADVLRPARYAPEGLCLRGLKKPVDGLSGFAEGWFQVQDEAAQLVGCLLDPRPGETVLDVCAGLGGKTGHIAQRMENRGTVVAADKNRAKLTRLKTEMDRLGVSVVQTCQADLERSLGHLTERTFQRVLLDAPCSGLGVLRRNPDAKWAADPKRLSAFARRQRLFLNQAASLVAPGGILVYAVCSMEPEETVGVADPFLLERPDFIVEAGAKTLPDPTAHMVSEKGDLRTFPHRDDMDGFFAIRFRRLP